MSGGVEFFQKGIFPVNIRYLDKENILYTIKTNPGSIKVDDAILLMDEFEKELERSYLDIKVICKYDEELANKICYDLYIPLLKPSLFHI